MSIVLSKKISDYYDHFRDERCIFTNDNIKSLKLDPREIYLKCSGGQWPCIINSSSLQMAKIIVGSSCGVFDILRQKKDVSVSLRYSFFENNRKIQFFITCNVTNIEKYHEQSDLVLLSLEFTQRPPDDLILKLGEFFEANSNAKFQDKEKIAINHDALKLLSIPKEETIILISNVPRKCVLKELSFGGCVLMLVGLAKFLKNKEAKLMLFFADTNEKITLSGVIVEADFMPGRKDISVVSISFAPEEIPMTYKFHINSYLTSSRQARLQIQEKNNLT